VTSWQFLVGVYFVVLLAALVVSFAKRKHSLKYLIWLGTAALSIPLLLVIGGTILFWNDFREPPSIAELQSNFPAKQLDLETILRMSDEDANYSQIAPTFVGLKPDKPNEPSDRYMEKDSGAKLPKMRWDAYRAIYKRNGIELGIHRNSSGDVFIIIRSKGFVTHGQSSGYVHCSPSASAQEDRFEPCTMQQDAGDHKYSGGEEGYAFQRLNERWFAYSEED
jgi:hypothetical protein